MRVFIPSSPRSVRCIVISSHSRPLSLFYMKSCSDSWSDFRRKRRVFATLIPLLWRSECVGSMQWRRASIFLCLKEVVLYLPADHGPISMSCTVVLSPKLNLSEPGCADLGSVESCDGRGSFRLRACCGYCVPLSWYYSFEGTLVPEDGYV